MWENHLFPCLSMILASLTNPTASLPPPSPWRLRVQAKTLTQCSWPSHGRVLEARCSSFARASASETHYNLGKEQERKGGRSHWEGSFPRASLGLPALRPNAVAASPDCSGLLGRPRRGGKDRSCTSAQLRGLERAPVKASRYVSDTEWAPTHKPSYGRLKAAGL